MKTILTTILLLVMQPVAGQYQYDSWGRIKKDKLIQVVYTDEPQFLLAVRAHDDSLEANCHWMDGKYVKQFYTLDGQGPFQLFAWSKRMDRYPVDKEKYKKQFPNMKLLPVEYELYHIEAKAGAKCITSDNKLLIVHDCIIYYWDCPVAYPVYKQEPDSIKMPSGMLISKDQFIKNYGLAVWKKVN